MPLVFVLNGPNLNLLGRRQPDIYGTRRWPTWSGTAGRSPPRSAWRSNSTSPTTRAPSSTASTRRASGRGHRHQPGRLHHTSVAILDALKAFDGPVIEVHISNVHQRESFRHHSYVSLRADGVIAGCGTEGLPAGSSAGGEPGGDARRLRGAPAPRNPCPVPTQSLWHDGAHGNESGTDGMAGGGSLRRRVRLSHAAALAAGLAGVALGTTATARPETRTLRIYHTSTSTRVRRSPSSATASICRTG